MTINAVPNCLYFLISSDSLTRRLRQRRHVTDWQRSIAKGNVTLHTNKLSVRLPLVHLVVQHAAVVRGRGDVTTLCATTRFHRHLRRLRIVANFAFCFSVYFMPERTCRRAPAPRSHRNRIVKPNRPGQLLIKIGLTIPGGRLVTTVTVPRQRRQLAFLVVTSETVAMSQRRRLERAFLQPESVAMILRRFGHKFLVRITLRLTSLVTSGAFAILMLVVRKRDFEIGNKVLPFRGRKERFAKTGKRKTRRIARTRLNVAIRTDLRRGSFAREELPAMTLDARLVIGKLSNIRKGVLANRFPIR